MDRLILWVMYIRLRGAMPAGALCPACVVSVVGLLLYSD